MPRRGDRRGFCQCFQVRIGLLIRSLLILLRRLSMAVMMITWLVEYVCVCMQGLELDTHQFAVQPAVYNKKIIY